jgi:hypothetical protein
MKSEKLTTKRTHRQGAWRGLAFEQMESRLALSTTLGIYATNIELHGNSDAVLATYPGGFVDFDVQSHGNQVRYYVAGSFQESEQPLVVSSLNLRAWIQFEGTLSGYDSSDFATIPQPTVGPTKPHSGMIAIGEIFAVAPLVKMGDNAEDVAQTIRGQFEQTEETSFVGNEQLSLTRGRDVYFDVAARGDNGEFERSVRPDRTEASVVSAQLGADEELNQNFASASIAALAARGRSLPRAQNSLPSEPVQIREAAPPFREAPSVSQTSEPKNEAEKTPQPKQVSKVEVRDQVFQAWRDSKLDVAKRVVGRPAEEEQDESANWPVLAALAVGGMVFSSRRLASSAPAQQQPPTRKPLGFSRRNS